MHLKYPICLTIIVPIIIVFMIGLWLRRKSRPTVFIPHLSAFRDISVSPFRKIFTLILETISAISLLILVILFVIISARPQQKIEKTQSKSGLDIVMLLDGSGSMFYSLDDTVTQSPLEASRLVIKNFVSKLENDRVALITFSGTAYTLCPLTFDYSIIEYYLDLMTDENAMWFIEGAGTAIGDAIILGTEKFQKDIDRTKIIILITDGEANEGIDPMRAAEYAKEADVKVYSIFVSSYDYSTGYEDLERISDQTGAKAYKAQNKEALEQVFQDIQELEKTEIEYVSQTIYRDVPMVFIALSSFFLLTFVISRYTVSKLYL